MEIIWRLVGLLLKPFKWFLGRIVLPLILLSPLFALVNPVVNTRGRKVIRDIQARRGRTTLVATAIFVGVAGTIAMFTLSLVLVGQLGEDVKEEELPMLGVYVTVNTDAPLDNEAYIQALAEQPDVTEVLAIVNVAARFKTDPEQEDYEDGFLFAYNVPYEPELPMMPMRLVEGQYPVPGVKEVAIEQRMAEEYNLKVGDKLYFNILSPNDEGKVGTEEAWQISGIVFHPYVGVDGSGAQPDVSVYTYQPEANYISGQVGYSGFLARFTTFEASKEHKDQFAGYIANETPYVPVFVQNQDPAQNELLRNVQLLGNTMGALALIALVVSGFLVVNVISSMVVEQKRQIGTMKSIGATFADNFFMYAGIAFTYGLIAVFWGLIAGIILGNTFTQLLAPELNTYIQGFKVSPPAIILGIVVGLLIPVLASIIPVFFGSRVTILEAITDLGIDASYGSGPIAKFIGILPVPITVRQGLSNVSLKKARLIFTVITLSIAVGAFMGIFALFNNLTEGINIYLDSFNVQVGVFPNQGKDANKVLELLETNYRNPEHPEQNIIKTLEPGFFLQVEFEGYTPAPTTGGPPGIFAYGYDVNSETPAFNFTIDEGEPLTEATRETGIIFSSMLAGNMDVKIGDTVTIKVPGNQADLKVVGISNYPLDQVWIDWRTIATIAGYTIADVGSPLALPPEAQAFIPYASLVELNGSEVTALGFSAQADAMFGTFMTLSEGGPYQAGQNQVLVSQSLAESQNIKVGDTLRLGSTENGGQTADFTVSGILELPPQMTDVPSDLIATFWEDLAAFDGKNLEGEPRPQGYFIVTDKVEPTVKELDEIVEDMNDTLLSNGVSAQYFNFVELVEQINQAFLTFQIVLQAVAFLIALVGALGLFTTLSMSVFERQKEIGVMRSIGAGSMTVITQFLTEGLVVGIIAWIVGLPLGYGIMMMLFNITGFDETFNTAFPVAAAILGLIGMLVITFFASIWPSLQASRKTVSDILRYQ